MARRVLLYECNFVIWPRKLYSNYFREHLLLFLLNLAPGPNLHGQVNILILQFSHYLLSWKELGMVAL